MLKLGKLGYSIKRILEVDNRTDGQVISIAQLTSEGRCIVLDCVWESGREDIVRFTRNPFTVMKTRRIYPLLDKLGPYFPKLIRMGFYPSLRGWLIHEEKLSGRQIKDVEWDVAAVAAVAEALAHLHQVTSAKWSRTRYFPSYGPYYEYIFNRWIKKRLVRWVDRTPGIDRTAYMRWFAGFRPLINRVSRFNLLHWDINPYNLLYHDGRVGVIDFEFARFGIFWEDFFMAQFRFAGEDELLQQAFRRRYFECFHDPEMELKQGTQSFHLAFAYLRHLNGLHRRFNKTHDPVYKDQYAKYEQRLRDLVERTNPPFSKGDFL